MCGYNCNYDYFPHMQTVSSQRAQRCINGNVVNACRKFGRQFKKCVNIHSYSGTVQDEMCLTGFSITDFVDIVIDNTAAV